MSDLKLDNIYEECPKTFEMFRQYLINKYKNEKGGSEIESFLTDNMLQLNIQTAPMSLIYFFDEQGLIGTIHYDSSEKQFICMCNGNYFKIDNDFVTTEDRIEAEKILIKYLFMEVEKTL